MIRPATPDAKLYRDAADVIRKHGHAKHTLGRDNGPVCLLGALNAVAYGGPTRWPTPDLTDTWSDVGADLAKHLPEQLPAAVATIPEPLNRVVTWNDSADVAGDDVINLFERAAKAQEETKQ